MEGFAAICCGENFRPREVSNGETHIQGSGV
jgi:hypothetical protein